MLSILLLYFIHHPKMAVASLNLSRLGKKPVSSLWFYVNNPINQIALISHYPLNPLLSFIKWRTCIYNMILTVFDVWSLAITFQKAFCLIVVLLQDTSAILQYMHLLAIYKNHYNKIIHTSKFFQIAQLRVNISNELQRERTSTFLQLPWEKAFSHIYQAFSK